MPATSLCAVGLVGGQRALCFFILFMSTEEQGLPGCYPCLLVASDVAVSSQRSPGWLTPLDPLSVWGWEAACQGLGLNRYIPSSKNRYTARDI